MALDERITGPDLAREARHLHLCNVSEAHQLEGEARQAEYERIYLRGDADAEIPQETINQAADRMAKRGRRHGDRDLTMALAAPQARER